MTRLIDDALVEKALRTLSTTAQETAAARAIRVRAEFRRKRVRAQLILQSNERSAELRAAFAEASDAYQEVCEAEVEAVERDEALRAERNDAAVILEVFRTEAANARAGSNFR